MRRWIPVVLVLVLVGCSAVPAASLNVEEAADLVLSSILPTLDLDGNYVVFLYPSLLGTGDELAPYAPSVIPESVQQLPYLVPYSLADGTWFAWIDLDPYARYEHDTLFLLIADDDSAVVVHHERWWPVLNGTSLWVNASEYWDADNWIASSLSYGIPEGQSDATCTPDLPGSDYYDWALVVNGWVPGQPCESGFAADFNSVCAAFNDLGMRTSVLDIGEASPEALENHVIRLFTEIPLYNCCDRLYCYITCHASPGALWIGGRRLSAPELARMLTLPGDTYVPSRVDVYLEAGYSGAFLDELSKHSNINRVWTASAVDGPAYSDLDSNLDPNPDDVGGEWTSSVLAELERLLAEDALAIQAAEYGREYMPINMACGQQATWNAAVAEDLSHPVDYLFSDSDPTKLLADLEYLARWDRLHHINRGNLDEIIAQYEGSPCMELLWFLHNMARHDCLPRPAPEFNERIGKGAAKDLAHSDWWTLCDVFWEILTTPVEGEP